MSLKNYGRYGQSLAPARILTAKERAATDARIRADRREAEATLRQLAQGKPTMGKNS